MCGIHGIVRLSDDAPPIDREELLRTREAMRTRGPDGAGLWLSDDGRTGLGQRRLAILDLSDAAAQPMASADGRYRIVFNGEIYNFRALRNELARDGHRFRSTGDTEVVLALFAAHGAEAFRRLQGMYALAIWDTVTGRLVLARDPFGIKPLYYTPPAEAGGGTLRFASSVKALEAGGAIPMDPDPAAVAGFLLWGSVPEPRTIRRAVRAVPAGTWMAIDPDGVQAPRPIVPEVPGEGMLDWPEAIDDSVRAHLVSDVPVAVFLSAGLDSATLAAIAVRHLPEPPTTFTLRFEPTLGTDHDEGPLAAETARHLGTRHVEHTVGRDDFAELWSDALDAMDQPSIDGFNTFLVSRSAAQAGLKVVLSGLGGDELLGGYPSFSQVPRMARFGPVLGALGKVPGLARGWAAVARRLRPDRPKLPGLLRHGRGIDGAYALRRGLFLPEELPALFESLGVDRAGAPGSLHDPVAHARGALHRGPGTVGTDRHRTPWRAVQTLEASLYMRNQLLRDADWASMAHSVELRVPFVDPWLWRRPSPAARAEAERSGKAAILRRVAPELPAGLWTRPKTGFYIPVMDWLHQPAGNTARRNLGLDSRRLALRILSAWGIEGAR